jgi:FkbM family methyltransferase|uniref:Methyltransferase FkbM domain-containing protein n=1 Tax=viral metagenome TaxID=1070528 RepID=A0A6C0K8A6_9ZZZZ
MRLKGRLNSSKLIKVVILIAFVVIVGYYMIINTDKTKEQFAESAIFTNDNNVSVLLMDHKYSTQFKTRDNNEVLFRKIITFLINNGTIENNIIDLGAWIGDNSIPWAMNIDGTVYAIDPSSDNCNFIRKMSELNNVTNVTVLEYAISNVNETLSTNDNMEHCSFVNGNAGINGKHKVNAVSLDYLYETGKIKDIGFIHLDVEGMEFKVIQGSSKIVDEYNPIIAFEQHIETDDFNTIIRHLNEKQYRVFLIDEVTGGRPDCRNFIAFPNGVDTDNLVNSIGGIIGQNKIIPK